jgi:signal transduction histidine kinase
MLSNFYCEGEPSLFGIFDLNYAPPLLFYSYIPIIIVAIFLGIYILIKDKKSLQSKLLFLVALFFAIWALNQIGEWITVPVRINHFLWETISAIEMLIPIFSFYFVYVFLNKRDLPLKHKVILGILFLPVILALPTKLNMASFDALECQANNGAIWIYIYFFEALAIFAIMDLFYRKFHSLAKGDSLRKQIAFLAPGVFLFLGLFTATNILGDFFLIYNINLIGPVGMVIFFALMTYMIVRFNIFNIRLLAAQALVAAIIVLVGSQLFFIRTVTNRILTTITLILSLFGGYLLIKSVKKEVRQREELARLNADLQTSIKQRQGLVHLVTHKVKGSFTRSKYIFAELLEGTFGPISAKVKDIAQKGLKSDNEGINTVDLVLQADNLQSGLVKYDLKTLNFKDIAAAAVTDKTEQARVKGLKITTDFKESAYNVSGDAIWLKEVVSNLIDNAIKYSPRGEIQINLEKKENKILLSVKDSGIGLTEEDKKHLFKAGGRGKDSLIYNVDSTGYGLYTVKMIIEAHQGRVWAESAGRDKGSTFWLELPAEKK